MNAVDLNGCTEFKTKYFLRMVLFQFYDTSKY